MAPPGLRDGPSPKSAALGIYWPIRVSLRGIFAPCLRKVEIPREESSCPPSASEAPLRNKAGISASRTKGVKAPLPSAIPTGLSAARRTSLRRPSPNLNRAWAGYVLAGEDHCRQHRIMMGRPPKTRKIGCCPEAQNNHAALSHVNR